MKLVTTEELAEILRLSKSSIAHSIHNRPQSLPPIVRIPGTRRVLFRDVDKWLDALTVSCLTTTHPAPQSQTVTKKSKSTIKRGRGRPATPAIGEQK